MNLDALGMAPLPEWSGQLRTLYWKIREHRGFQRPSKKTWYRRVQAEKVRLLGLGVPQIEIHLVCRILACDRFQQVRQWNAERRYVRYMALKQRGESAW